MGLERPSFLPLFLDANVSLREGGRVSVLKRPPFHLILAFWMDTSEYAGPCGCNQLARSKGNGLSVNGQQEVGWRWCWRWCRAILSVLAGETWRGDWRHELGEQVGSGLPGLAGSAREGGRLLQSGVRGKVSPTCRWSSPGYAIRREAKKRMGADVLLCRTLNEMHVKRPQQR